MRTAPRRTAAAVGAVLMLAVAGCDATVRTRITVTAADSTTVVADVHFTDEAAAAILADPITETALIKTIASRTGGRQPERSGNSHDLTYRSTLTFDQLKGSADVLGVTDAALTGAGNAVTLTLKLTKPQGLVNTLKTQTANEADGPALADTMARSTVLQIQVIFPGGVTTATTATGAAGTVTTNDTTATITQTAAGLVPGTYTVTGDPTLSTGKKIKKALGSPWTYFIAALLIGVFGVWCAWRKGLRPRREARQ